MYKLFHRHGSCFGSCDFTDVLYDSYSKKLYFELRSREIGYFSDVSYLTYAAYSLQLRIFRSIYSKRMLWS